MQALEKMVAFLRVLGQVILLKMVNFGYTGICFFNRLTICTKNKEFL